jgi:hypothetical protein
MKDLFILGSSAIVGYLTYLLLTFGFGLMGSKYVSDYFVIIVFSSLFAGGFVLNKAVAYGIKMSPYFKLKRKLEYDLDQAENTRDYKSIQQIKIHLLWLRELERDAAGFSMFFKGEENKTNQKLCKLPEEDLYPPDHLSYSDKSFCSEVILQYKCTSENDYAGCMFKPIELLPYPKEYIRAVIDFATKYLTKNPIEGSITYCEGLDELKRLSENLDRYVDVKAEMLPTNNSENISYCMRILNMKSVYGSGTA